jgi:15-cis-phytoene desaturase
MTDAIIIGAGLAGLSCAFELVDKGYKVKVLEAREVIGGRTSSWIDGGLPVESGLHRFLGSYDTLPALIKRAGLSLDDIICWEDEFEIKVANGPSAVFGLSPVYKPFKTISGFLGNTHFFTFKDKIALAKFFFHGLRMCRKDHLKLDQFSVAEFAKKFQVREEIIHNLLIPLTAGLFFLPPDRYSAYVFFQVFVIAFRKWYKLRFGAFKGGMTEVLANPIAKAIQAKGGTVQTHARVDQLLVNENQVSGVQIQNEFLHAKHVVIATGIAQAQQLIKASSIQHLWFDPMLSLPSMPAVTLQIELTQPAMPLDRTTFAPGTCLEAFSEQSRTTFTASTGRLSIIIGPPEKFIHLSADELLTRVVEDSKTINLDLASYIKEYRKVVWPADFYLIAPGYETLRPSQQTPIRGLLLAGDYTQQPFLASMEGAAVSGKLAAEAILKGK